MADEDKTYNGWKNYETWNVNLWIGNDEGMYHEAEERARRQWRKASARPNWTRREVAEVELAKELKEWMEELCPDLGASMWSDLLSASLSEVVWIDIARHLLENEEDDEAETDEDEDTDEEDEA